MPRCTGAVEVAQIGDADQVGDFDGIQQAGVRASVHTDRMALIEARDFLGGQVGDGEVGIILEKRDAGGCLQIVS